MIFKTSVALLSLYGIAAATPISSRAVLELNQEAFEEAQQRDETATRAFSDVPIKTSDGRCLFVDILSGDFRANLTPLQVAECGTTAGQGFDAITSGVHNDQPGNALIVSSLTNGCVSFDDRRAEGDKVILFSCGGRADGGGEVSDSQLFAFDGAAAAGPIQLVPDNGQGKCLAVNVDRVDIAVCDAEDEAQMFTFGEVVEEDEEPVEEDEEPVEEDEEPVEEDEEPVEEDEEEAPVEEEEEETPVEEEEETPEEEEEEETPEEEEEEETPEEEEEEETPEEEKEETPVEEEDEAPVEEEDEEETPVEEPTTAEDEPTVTADEEQETTSASISIHCGKTRKTRTVTITRDHPTATATAEETVTTTDAAVTESDSTSFKSTSPADTISAAPETTESLETTETTETTEATETPETTDISETTIEEPIETPETTEARETSEVSETTTTANPTITEAPVDIPQPTDEATPVSRAGDFFNPKAAEEAHTFDPTAVRDSQSVQIRAVSGTCLTIDPTAGDFRQNLIPVSLAACSADNSNQNQHFDIISSGLHNDGSVEGGVLVVSSQMNGCLSFDGRRAEGDEVVVFSCGGRAAGEGGTNTGQVYELGEVAGTVVLRPASEGGQACGLPGDGRIVAGECGEDSVYEIIQEFGA